MMPKSKLSAEAREFFRRAGSRGGKLGSKARMEKLTPEKRKEVARKAAAVRWKKKEEPAKV